MSHGFDKLSALRGQLPLGPPEPTMPATKDECAKSPFTGKLIVRHERKGRGGKTVTVVQGVALAGEALQAFARSLKKALGCGATLEGNNIVLHGDLVDRVTAYLAKYGAEQIVRGSHAQAGPSVRR